ncbi:phototropin-1 [Dorcoceras hygrometricum]|uniref:non-specific serine/threonine protein kinase n=1 Tax=Dorcoceras hygrometricum TaxID=472368 RepID=A0A2Z7APX5_9LAMI|nr:phototropin-1 [Dorcoceras hygrometricum]
MEPTEQNSRNKPPAPHMPTLPRDSRGSLEVFNPSNYSSLPSRPANPVFRPQPTWQSWAEDPEPEPEPKLFGSKPGKPNAAGEGITSWMALKEPVITPPPEPAENQSPPAVSSKTVAEIFNEHDNKTSQPSKSPATGENGDAAQRAAEWGLVLKTDEETGKLQGVKVRTSGDENTSRVGNSRRDSGNSVRSSGDLSDDGTAGKERGIPRVSEDLRNALSAFQQTFVVSDATKNDYPIMYASAGFFKMTGYTSKEGKDTNPEDVSKIRESLEKGLPYCGRLLNYKKDGTPFWNLLTISPIKDENGKVLKYIGMQVEVSKHTEGAKESMTRPNGLPESLIRYDARQKDMATSSVTELVNAVKKPQRARALSESANRPLTRKSEGDIGGHHTGSRPTRRHSHSSARSSMEKISEVPEKTPKKASRRSFIAILKKGKRESASSAAEEAVPDFNVDDDYHEDDEDMFSSESDDDDRRPESVDDKVRKKEMRKGIDLATTLERIEKNFVITDPRLPDNPIIFASDSFLELTEYSREEILGRNCRFLQGPETDPSTVKKIRQAIDNQTDVTVQLINYTKSGKKFWNLFHLQPMRDQKGEVQYFIGVQLDGSEHVEPIYNCIPEAAAKESAILVKQTAENVDEAVRELPDANKKPDDLWMNHSKAVHPKPHRKDSPPWKAIQKVLANGEEIGLKHFKPIKPLGSGDTGSVHLVELCETGHYFAMKAMDKNVMLNRNKVHRACAEREILDLLDHPFLPALYASFQTKTHICLITDYYPGGELFILLDRQPTKVLKEDAVRFYAAEVVIALEYLHCQGIIYRDLKPENILLQDNGHVSLTDFDLSCLTSCKPQLLIPEIDEKKRRRKSQDAPIFMAEPMRASNSFVGTEEYIAPEIISGEGHTSAVDWWALGILLYEMLYGYTPFRGKTRQKTFANILHKDLKFPRRKEVSVQGKQLMYRLLTRDPKNRLGSREGANEVKQHPFFRGINWALVRCMDPPTLDAALFDGKDKDVDLGLEELQKHF